MQLSRAAFKAYDIRGRVPEELNEEMAYRIGRAFVEQVGAKTTVIGRDVRLSSDSLSRALAEGLMDGGSDVIDIGICGTEMVYFGTGFLGADGGIMVTASHNPMEYNGMKLVRAGAVPISGDSGLQGIADTVLAGGYGRDGVEKKGKLTVSPVTDDYIKHLLTYVDLSVLKPLKIVVNAGNGCAGPIVDELEKQLPFDLIKVHHSPDGTFPNGVPNPMLLENQEATAKVVREAGADFGVAWDGDFDRCFLFDEKGQYIEGYYLIGLLAEILLAKYPGAKIIHDTRLTWGTIEAVEQHGGTPVMTKTGHAFMKERLRKEDAVYGGEMSAHHYFKDFYYCDSGMIPWLLAAVKLCREGRTLSEMIAAQVAKYPCSGEINRRVQDAPGVIQALEAKYVPGCETTNRIDGLSVDYAAWRFNVRMSNTEPLLRLNVETRGDKALLQEKTAELLAFIGGEEA